MIETRELRKTYGGVAALEEVTFTAQPGRVTGFLGLNGSGKTTTLRILLGLSRATAGGTLAAQCIAAAVITTVTAALSGLTVAAGGGEQEQYDTTLLVVPLITFFGVAVATIVRRPTWLLIGSMVWLLFAEGVVGKLDAPLPFSSVLTASTGNRQHLLIFIAWTAGALLVAGYSINRDLTGE